MIFLVAFIRIRGRIFQKQKEKCCQLCAVGSLTDLFRGINYKTERNSTVFFSLLAVAGTFISSVFGFCSFRVYPNVDIVHSQRIVIVNNETQFYLFCYVSVMKRQEHPTTSNPAPPPINKLINE